MPLLSCASCALCTHAISGLAVFPPSPDPSAHYVFVWALGASQFAHLVGSTITTRAVSTHLFQRVGVYVCCAQALQEVAVLVGAVDLLWPPFVEVVGTRQPRVKKFIVSHRGPPFADFPHRHYCRLHALLLAGVAAHDDERIERVRLRPRTVLLRE